MSSNMSVNASDVGLIVQGTLIFLSSLVAVLGYFIQSKMRLKEKQREKKMQDATKLNDIKLARIREKATKFIGPAAENAMTIGSHLSYLRDYTEKVYPEEWKRFRAQENGPGVGWNNGPGTEGPQTNKRNWNGQWNRRWTLVGSEIEQLMREDPTSPYAVNYRQNMRAVVETNGRPLALLINLHGQSLQHWGNKAEYKKKFPVAATNGMLRNLFPVQLVRWVAEMDQIIKQQWDKEVFASFWPVVNPYPTQIWSHFTSMMTAIRELEVELGLASHQISKDSWALGGETHGMTADEIIAHQARLQKKAEVAGSSAESSSSSSSKDEESRKKKEKRKLGKYAVVGAVGGAVVAAIVPK
jgi:hypothetical protein